MHRIGHFATRLFTVLCLIATGGCVSVTSAQSLNWEGQTGIFVTPLAYTIPSPQRELGLPAVAYHYFDGGPVLGGFHQASITIGAFGRVEFGYTRDFHEYGATKGLSDLWPSGFNVVHGKFNFLAEDERWRPALSVGFVLRSQVRNVGGVILGQKNTNADFYVVGTKTVTKFRKIPLVFNFGLKVTNASLLGLAGNAPAYQGRLFGAAAFAVRGPRRSTILLGSEVSQEPRRVQGLAVIDVPTTVTYAIRVVPRGTLPLRGWEVEKPPKLTVDLGLAQAVGTVAPGLDLKARLQFALGITYGF